MRGHRKTDSLNDKPFDPKASPERKAEEFDRQYGQNRKFTETPNADQLIEKSKGRHRR